MNTSIFNFDVVEQIKAVQMQSPRRTPVARPVSSKNCLENPESLLSSEEPSSVERVVGRAYLSPKKKNFSSIQVHQAAELVPQPLDTESCESTRASTKDSLVESLFNV